MNNDLLDVHSNKLVETLNYANALLNIFNKRIVVLNSEIKMCTKVETSFLPTKFKSKAKIIKSCSIRKEAFNLLKIENDKIVYSCLTLQNHVVIQDIDLAFMTDFNSYRLNALDELNKKLEVIVNESIEEDLRKNKSVNEYEYKTYLKLKEKFEGKENE